MMMLFLVAGILSASGGCTVLWKDEGEMKSLIYLSIDATRA